MRKLSLVLVIVVMSSCVTSSIVRLNHASRRPLTEDMVTTFQTEFAVPVEFEKMAVVSVKGMHLLGRAGMLKRLRTKAGRLGANGIILAGGSRGKEYLAIAIYVFWEKER